MPLMDILRNPVCRLVLPNAGYLESQETWPS